VTLRKLGSTLGEWAPERRSPGDPLLAIAAAWPEVVGKEVAANAWPSQIERGALLVTARSGAWSQQLTFLSEQILGAIRERFPEVTLERLRMRVGKLPAVAARRGEVVPGQTAAPSRQRPKALDAQAALAGFQADVQAYQRAKRTAGWKECQRCGALIAPRSQAFCVVCVNARDDDRAGIVARLLFEAPWLGPEEVLQTVAGLTPEAYDRIRRRLLRAWVDELRLARKRHAVKAEINHVRIRKLASSYVLLETRIDPNRLELDSPVRRNALGDLYAFIREVETGN